MASELADRAARALLEAAPAGSRVILFGSQAAGNARPDSDMDFLVIEPEVGDRFGETLRLRRAVETVFGDRVQPVDLIVTDAQRFCSQQDTPNTLAYEAAQEGLTYG